MRLSSSSSRRRVLGVIALATLFVAAQASSFTHRLLVQHAVCAEHGELVHLEGGHAAALAASAVDREVSAAPSPTKDHDHEHCLVTLPRREDFFVQVPAAVVVLRPISLPIFDRDWADCAVTSLELLLRAPKSSPPA